MCRKQFNIGVWTGPPDSTRQASWSDSDSDSASTAGGRSWGQPCVVGLVEPELTLNTVGRDPTLACNSSVLGSSLREVLIQDAGPSDVVLGE